MSRFIETIRAENGLVQQLERHQQRMSRTLEDHGLLTIPSLKDILNDISFPDSGRIRIRIEYGTNEHMIIEQFPYTRRMVRKIRMMHIAPPDYRYKYADRAWINALSSRSEADEILIIREGRITDVSIANIAFFDGRDWWTPDAPLLKGTERGRLIENGVIRETEIRVGDLGSFKGLRLMNAMLPWEDDVTYDMSVIDPVVFHPNM